MYPVSYIPIIVFSVLATLAGLRWGILAFLLVGSYCGLILHSFTGGPSGGIWLVQLMLLVALPITALKGTASPMQHLPRTGVHILYAVYTVGVLVGFLRYDEVVELLKGHRVGLVMGMPLSFAMAAYRLTVIAALILAFSIPLYCAVDSKLFRRLCSLVFIATVCFAVASIVSYFGVIDLSYSVRGASGQRHVAVLGFNRAAAGLMLTTGAFVTWAAILEVPKAAWTKGLYVIGTAIILLGLLTTWSRSGVVAVVVGAVALLWAEGLLRRPSVLILVLCLGGCVTAGIYTIPGLAERFSVTEGGPTGDLSAGRVAAWWQLMEWLIKTPDVAMFGVGFQNFQYAVKVVDEAIPLEAAHNMYLHMFTELGFVGLVVFLYWIVRSLRWFRDWHRFDRLRGVASPAGVIFGLMVGLLASGMTQESLVPNPSMVPFLLHFFLLLGIWTRYYREQLSHS